MCPVKAVPLAVQRTGSRKRECCRCCSASLSRPGCCRIDGADYLEQRAAGQLLASPESARIEQGDLVMRHPPSATTSSVVSFARGGTQAKYASVHARGLADPIRGDELE
jgi:hypothetical protein